MTLDPKDLTAATAALAAELAALDACGPDWSPPDQARYVRVLLEDGIDELARNDDAHHDYVADCVLLAGQNMQDARLQLIEERLDAVESPPTTVANLVIDTAIMLGFELAFVIGAEVAVPGLIALAAARLRARTTRQLTTGPAAMVAENEFVGRLIADVADRQATVDVMREFARQGPGGLTQLGEHTALAELATARHRLRVAEAAVATGEPVLAKVQTALTSPAAAPTSPDLAAFLAGVVKDTTVSRVAENGATAVTALLTAAALPLAAPGGGPSRVFLTSLVAGRMLSQVRQEQETAARDWRLLRFAVRCLPDAALLGSPFAQELCLRIRLFTVDPVVEGGLVDSREALVLGMETQLWLAWLRHIDALGVVMTGDFPAVRQRGPEIAPGMVFEDKHVHEAKLLFVGLGVATYGCRGALYPGIRRLTDGLAEFLYLRYAHPYFLAHPDDAPSPLIFDPVRYEEVPGMPPQSPLGLTDIDRADRVGEMKLLVIAFFQMIDTAPDTEIGGSDAKPARDVLRALLDAPDPLAAYLKALPETSEPDRPPDEPAPEPVTDPTPAGPGVVADPRLTAEVSVQLLGTLVTDLEVAILTDDGPASFDDSAEGQAERVAALDLAARIEALLDAVPLQQKVAEGLAAQFPDLLDRVRAYGPRVTQLADAWSRSGWQYDESFTP